MKSLKDYVNNTKEYLKEKSKDIAPYVLGGALIFTPLIGGCNADMISGDVQQEAEKDGPYFDNIEGIYPDTNAYTAIEGEAYFADIDSSGDGDILHTLVDGPSEMRILDEIRGDIYWSNVVDSDSDGEFTYTVRATNEDGAYYEETFLVTIN